MNGIYHELNRALKKAAGLVIAAAVAASLPVCGISAQAAEKQASSSAAASTAKNEAYAADVYSVIGKWYVVGLHDGSSEAIFDFGEDAIVQIIDENDTAECEYTVEDGLITLLADFDGETEQISMPAVIYKDLLLISIDDIIDPEEFKPYKSGTALDDYFESAPMILSKEPPERAEQSKLLGTWVCTEWDQDDGINELGIVIFKNKSTVTIDGTESYSEPIILENGKAKAAGKLPEGVSYDLDTDFYTCGGRVFYYDGDDLIILERYKKKKLTDKMLKNTVNEYGFYFKSGKLWVVDEKGKKTSCDYDIGKISINFIAGGENVIFKYYVTDKNIYFVHADGNLLFKRKK